MPEKIGHYTILSQLGRGGMGVVFKAHEESLNRFVAIKVLGEHLAEDEAFLARFIREARAAAALSHPNVTQIYFIGQDQGRHYFAMEYVSGRSLQTMIKEEGAIQNPKAAQMIAQAAHGLAAAHDHGLIHRDIKPANLVLDHRGVVKLLDFGIALPSDVQNRITATGMLVGTPGYASPEQCTGEPIDHRTDIYALGVTFYEMLTGVLPFRSTSPLALLREIMHDQPRDIAELNPAVDEETRRIVRKMLAKDRNERYQTCHELIADLEEYLGARGVRNLTAGLASAVAPTTEQQAEIATRVESGAGKPIPATAVLGDKSAAPTLVTPPPPGSQAPTQPSAPAHSPATLVQGGVAPAAASRQAPSAQPAAAAPRRRSAAVIVLIVVVLALGGAAVAGIVFFRSSELGKSLSLTAASVTGQPATKETGAADAAAPTEPTESQPIPVPPNSEFVSSAPPSTDQSEVSQPVEQAPTQVPTKVIEAQTSRPAPQIDRKTDRSLASRDESETPAPPRKLSGVAISVSGDPAIETLVANLLESEITSAGLDARDRERGSAGSLLDRLRRQGVANLIVAQIEQTGERELRYMGRSETAFGSRVNLTAYDVATGKVVKRSSVPLEYTQMSAERAVEKALGRAAQELVGAIAE